jgi:hypothetical protein
VAGWAEKVHPVDYPQYDVSVRQNPKNEGTRLSIRPAGSSTHYIECGLKDLPLSRLTRIILTALLLTGLLRLSALLAGFIILSTLLLTGLLVALVLLWILIGTIHLGPLSFDTNLRHLTLGASVTSRKQKYQTNAATTHSRRTSSGAIG